MRNLLVASVVTAMIWTPILAFVDMATGERVNRRVGVVSKRHEPAHSVAATHFVGRGIPVQSVTREPERFVLLISRDGRAQSRDVAPDVYAVAEVGHEIDLPFRVGRWTGIEY